MRKMTIEDNDISAENQLGGRQEVVGEVSSDAGYRVLFIGNSMTLHLPKPENGWTNCNGMAASCPEKDYVHVFMELIKKHHPDADFMISQMASWERNFWDDSQLEKYRKAADYNADLIIFRLGENVRLEDMDKGDLTAQTVKMMEFIKNGRQPRVLMSNCFWKAGERDEALMKAAQQLGYPCIEMRDLGDDESNMAIDIYGRNGLGMHPGDKGMEAMARRFYEGYLKLNNL